MAGFWRVYDTFNRRTISRHKSYAAAVAADEAYDRKISRLPGGKSYIPTIILEPGETYNNRR